jgi:ArsR family transcriptional regulator, arsenate/arsenite/antimonite-responsive transcriptional repressor
MKHAAATTALSALGDDIRLTLFRLLVERGPAGYPAGYIGNRLDLAPSKLSFHLKVLSEAGLITSRRDGRFLIYSANFDQMNALVAYLTENCCSLGTDCAPGCEPACAPARPATRRRSA